MLSKEQIITELRFIGQELKIQEFESQAVSQILAAYERANQATTTRLLAAIDRELSEHEGTRVLQEQAIARLRELQESTEQIIAELGDEVAREAADAAGEVGAFTYRDTNDILSWGGLAQGYDNVNMTANQIANLAMTTELGGRSLNDWMFSAFQGEHQDIYDEIFTDIRAGRMQGVGYSGIIADLKDRYGVYMDDPAVVRNVETVAISYIQTANSRAHQDIYDANSSVLGGVEWSAIMENGNVKTGRGTCPRCMALDGQTFDTVQDGPNCPLHPRCRCMYIPVVKPWSEILPGYDIDDSAFVGNTPADQIIAERDKYGASPFINDRIELLENSLVTLQDADGRYGTVADGVTSADYWSEQPKTWQDNAVGTVRANLIREGAISFDDIIDEEGDLIPIEDLGLSEETVKRARKKNQSQGD